MDCGLPYKHLESRLATRGLSFADVDAVFITHEHSDHIGCARQIAQQARIPVLMSRGTYAAVGEPDMCNQLQLVCDGTHISIKDLLIQPFTVAHDAKEPLQLVVTDGDKKFGLLTDLGHTTPHVVQCMAGLNAIVLECNHDPELLQASKYPPFLKQRVAGEYGHLSNAQAADFLQSIAHTHLRHVIAAHLSEQNNRPEFAQNALAAAIGKTPHEIGVADADTGFDWLTI
jgi:phosphoribosyl 1,2-cyclic phosphodiesterase